MKAQVWRSKKVWRNEMYGKKKSPPRQFDYTRTLGLRVVNATQDCKYSTHGGFSESVGSLEEIGEDGYTYMTAYKKSWSNWEFIIIFFILKNITEALDSDFSQKILYHINFIVGAFWYLNIKLR